MSSDDNVRIVRLIGGLGNQMFQYAFARSLGNDVLLDKTAFDSYKLWPYALEYLNIAKNYASPQAVAWFKKQKSPYPKFIRKLLNLPKYAKDSGVMQEPDLCFHPELSGEEGRKEGRYYLGYFQCEKYFAGIRNQLLQEFKLTTPLNAANLEMLRKIAEANAVSLHIRRGDYLKAAGKQGLCSLEYYGQAMFYMAEHVKAPHIFVFSDDIAWAKENLQTNLPMTFVDINSAAEPYFDLELMKNCKHNIIANSSFSWWGAWLNENAGKIVIAPKNWFADGAKIDVIPDNWIKM